MKKKVIARLFIKKDSFNVFKKYADELIQKSKNEPGCLVYHLLQDVFKEDEFVFIEEYKNGDALDAHFKSLYLNRFINDIQALQSKEMIVEIINLS